MNAGASDVGRVDLLKWWDALDDLLTRPDAPYVEERCLEGVQKARESQHQDARWLVSLLPTGEALTPAGLREVMLKQGDDPRGMYIAWLMSEDRPRISHGLLTRAAEKGYAPAQASLSEEQGEEYEARILWAHRAADQGDRRGLCLLGNCYEHGYGCRMDRDKAVESYRRAAELECTGSALRYGFLAFDRLDWERYRWWGFAAARGEDWGVFCASLDGLMPLFESGEVCRILHVVAGAIRGILKCVRERPFQGRELVDFPRILELHEAMLGRAKRAIDCWSIVGRRLRVVKDMRVMIAKMVWEEAWRWGEKEPVEVEEAKKQRAD